ncbi:MAG TPA: CheR family methyltransferase [Vicinamibacterales bacterium]
MARFRAVLASRLGLQFDGAQEDLLRGVLTRRTRATRQDVNAYLGELERGMSSEELRALPPALTVPETYFFRHRDQFRALSETVLPARLAARRGTKQLRIVSLGCASGEEAYSLAIAARAVVTDPAWEVSITGVDVNADLIAKARRGRFSRWSLRETTPAERARWFRADGAHYAIDDGIRDGVRFEVRNLMDADAVFWGEEIYDVVFCRNVLMYFTPGHARVLVDRIARALCRGGYLFLGHAETLRGISAAFDLCHTHDTFYYRRPLAPWDANDTPALTNPPAGGDVPDSSETWVDAIRTSCNRVLDITQRPAGAPADRSGGAGLPAADVARLYNLAGRERYDEALAMIDGLPEAVRERLDLLLIRAAILAHQGRHDEAERLCTELLERDGANAGARFVLATCRSAAGDVTAADREYAMAAHLEPGFALPRLHRGLLASRARDFRTARRELEAALLLVEHEDLRRIQLFGGGFSREALAGVCRAAIARTETLR